MKKDLLDSFIDPEDRLIKAAKKDLEDLSYLKIELDKENNLTIQVLESTLKEIIKNCRSILEKKSVILSFSLISAKAGLLKYCTNTYNVMKDLGIEIVFDYFKNKITNKIFNNIKWKDQWINNLSDSYPLQLPFHKDEKI